MATLKSLALLGDYMFIIIDMSEERKKEQMATDALGVLQTSVTKTSSFNSAGLDLKTGTPLRGLDIVVRYSAAANASGANAVTFSIEESDDNGTFYAKESAAAKVINLNTVAQAGEVHIHTESRKRYIRLVTTISGAGSTPTVTYESEIETGRP